MEHRSRISPTRTDASETRAKRTCTEYVQHRADVRIGQGHREVRVRECAEFGVAGSEGTRVKDVATRHDRM